MQYKILLFVLFLGLFGVWAQDDNNNSQENGSNQSGSGNNSGSDGGQSGGDHNSGDHSSGDHNSGDHSSGDHNSGDQSSGDHNSGSNSEEENENFHYPCKDLDIKCIQNFFLSTWQFTPVNHKDGQPIHMANMVAYMPKHNAKVKCTDVDVTLHGTKILTFFYNRRTKNIVITVMFDRIIISSPKTQIIAYRDGFEPVLATDSSKIAYQPMNITCVIPWRRRISMKDAEVSAFISNANPEFEIGKRISDSSNKHIQRTFEAFKNDPQTSTQELFQTKAYYCMHGYLQHYIAGYRYQFNGDLSTCH